MNIQEIQSFSHRLTLHNLGFGGLLRSKCEAVILEFGDFFDVVQPCCDFIGGKTSTGCVCDFPVKELQAAFLQSS